MALTKTQARRISSELRQAADAIIDYMAEHPQAGTAAERRQVRSIVGDLQVTAAEMTTQAVGLALDEMREPAESLLGVIGKAKEGVARITRIAKVIRVAGTLVSLATALAGRDAGGVLKAAGSLKKEFA